MLVFFTHNSNMDFQDILMFEYFFVEESHSERLTSISLRGWNVILLHSPSKPSELLGISPVT